MPAKHSEFLARHWALSVQVFPSHSETWPMARVRFEKRHKYSLLNHENYSLLNRQNDIIKQVKLHSIETVNQHLLNK